MKAETVEREAQEGKDSVVAGPMKQDLVQAPAPSDQPDKAEGPEIANKDEQRSSPQPEEGVHDVGQDKEDPMKDADMEGEKYEEMAFDPDDDGFSFTYDTALKLHRNVNMLQFIRRTLGISPGATKKEPKAFLQCVAIIESKLKAPLDLDTWVEKKHDHALLKVLATKGFDGTTLAALKEHEQFADVTFGDHAEEAANAEIYQRITDVCNVCRDELLGKGGMGGVPRRPARTIAANDGVINVSAPQAPGQGKPGPQSTSQ